MLSDFFSRLCSNCRQHNLLTFSLVREFILASVYVNILLQSKLTIILDRVGPDDQVAGGPMIGKPEQHSSMIVLILSALHQPELRLLTGVHK